MRLMVAVFPLIALVSPATTTIELRLQPGRLDYLLPAPTNRSVAFKVDARNAPPTCRITFTEPLPAGRHRYRIDVLHGRRERTLVIATPVTAGRSTFEVNITGEGRFDFGFWSGSAGIGEYRFTLIPPVRARTFQLDLPAR